MLPTNPQPLTKIFSNSIKIYRDTFKLILPISAILSALFILNRIFDSDYINKYKTKYPSDYVIRYLSNIDPLWVNLGGILVSILCFISIGWGICLVYDLVTKNEATYKTPLINSLKKFFHLISFQIMILGAGILLVSAIYYLLLLPFPDLTSAINKLAYSGVLITLVLLTVLCLINLNGVYFFEILIKKSCFFTAIKKAIKITFSMRGICRLLGGLTIHLLFTITAFILPLILLAIGAGILLIMKWSFIIKGCAIILTILLGFSTMTLIWVPVTLIMYTCFYNDLISRFEN